MKKILFNSEYFNNCLNESNKPHDSATSMEERGTQEITTELDSRHGHLIIQVDSEHLDST